LTLLLCLCAAGTLTATRTRAANVQAAGELSLSAKGNILIAAGQSQRSFEEGHQITDRGLLGSHTTTSRVGSEAGTAVASELGGKTIRIDAGHDLTVRGSQVIGDAGVLLSAKNDISIEAARNSSSQSSFTQTRTDGLFSSGGLSVTYGLQQQSSDSRSRGTSVQASTIGAVNGNLVIDAGQTYRQSGSDLSTPQGDISVRAQRIDITEARETTTAHTETLFKQSGLTLALTSPVLSAVQSVAAQAQAAQQTGSSRTGALAAANSAMALNNAGATLAQGQASPDASAAAQAGGINLSISLGASQSHSHSQSQSDSARGSTLRAGGNITLSARGGGQNSDITLQGASVQAGGTAALNAEDQINLLAASNTSAQSSSNKSSSGSIGVSVGTSGMGVTASASAARGHGNGSETTYSNTHVSGNTVTLNSGGDTTLKGAVVSGNSVKADIGGNLKIESLQDSASHHEKQTSVGASVTVGAGASGSVNASRTKIDSDYQSVVEQSGIRAGDGGFQVNVKGNTNLIGGAITSSDKALAEGKNSFTTTTLTTSELQNQAAYSAKSISVSAGTGAGSTSAGLGNQSGSASSTTRSGISGIAGDKAARTGDADSGIGRIFDQQAVKAEVQAQVAITQEFGKQAPKAVADFASSQIKDLDAQIKDAAANKDTTRVQELDAEKAKWAEGGDYRVAMHATIGALSGGVQGALGAAAAAQAAPTIDTLQAQMQTGLQRGLEDAGLSKDNAHAVSSATTKLVANGMSAGLGMAAGGTGGAAMAMNVDANNRQLHPTEARLIKDNAAAYASRRGISVERAEAELTQQAAQQFDSAWDTRLGSDNAQAQAFLKEIGTGKSMADPLTGQTFQLFTADEATRNNHAMFAQYAKADLNVQREMDLVMNKAYKPKDGQTLGGSLTGSDMALNDGARDYANMKNQPVVVQWAVLGEIRQTRTAVQGEYAQLTKQLGDPSLTTEQRGQTLAQLTTLEARDQALRDAARYQILDMSAAGNISPAQQREWTEGFGSALGAARLGAGMRAPIGARVDMLKGVSQEAQAIAAVDKAAAATPASQALLLRLKRRLAARWRVRRLRRRANWPGTDSPRPQATRTWPTSTTGSAWPASKPRLQKWLGKSEHCHKWIGCCQGRGQSPMFQEQTT
jgi:hypothetical protein